jgi:hypothetical protein
MIENIFRGIARVEAAAGATSTHRLQASERVYVRMYPWRAAPFGQRRAL